ncbi:MAG: hypothetical protein EVA89_14390 [Sandaracinaceae bacterium]|nr:MAG: hypothetical protein EVA89_14390 [Sandaracinaceae bacterium]
MTKLPKITATIHLSLVAAIAAFLFFLPGVRVVRDLRDPALAGPGVPERARAMHRELSPRLEAWARERVEHARGADTALLDVPSTEWPLFTAVFYLMATEQLHDDWVANGRQGESPMRWARGAVDASRDLLLDPSHHSWVRRHWGDDYLHEENVFFRSLLIAGLTSHAKLTGDVSPVLRDQVETLAADLDASALGLLHDYPGECYPIDVLAAVGLLRRADAVLDTDHSAFVARELRAFVGPREDALGLVPYRVSLPDAEIVQPGRGVGTSWTLVFAPEVYPEEAARWYDAHEAHFWQERFWAHGFREFAAGSELADAYGEWTWEVDAGPILGGFGTASSAFGLGAARANGRFDHAYTLASEMVATSWPLPDGTHLFPRLISSAADAPLLGEVAIAYFLAVPPAPGVTVVRGGALSGLVWISLAIYFGVSLVVFLGVGLRLREIWRPGFAPAAPAVQLGLQVGLGVAGVASLFAGWILVGATLLLVGALLPRPGPRPTDPSPARAHATVAPRPLARATSGGRRRP